MNKKKSMRLRSFASQDYPVEDIAKKLGMNESDVEYAIIEMGYRPKYRSDGNSSGRTTADKLAEDKQSQSKASELLDVFITHFAENGVGFSLTYAKAYGVIGEKRAMRDASLFIGKVREIIPGCKYVVVIERKRLSVEAIHFYLSESDNIVLIYHFWKYGKISELTYLRDYDNLALKYLVEHLESKGRVFRSRNICDGNDEQIGTSKNEPEVKRDSKRRRISNESSIKMYNLWRSGRTYKDIASEFGCSVATVRRHCDKMRGA